MQVDPVKPKLKAPGTKRLKPKFDRSLLNFAFKFNLRRYSEVVTKVEPEAAAPPEVPRSRAPEVKKEIRKFATHGRQTKWGWYPASVFPALAEWLRRSRDAAEFALAEAILVGCCELTLDPKPQNPIPYT